MFSRIVKRIFSMPSIKVPKVSFSLPKIKIPSVTFPTIVIPFKKITNILGAVNTAILVMIGGIGLGISYINPIPSITPYISLSLANKLFDTVVLLQANLIPTIGTSVALIAFGLLIHVANFKSWWGVLKATPMAILRSPVVFYRKVAAWRNWLLAKINYLNEESAKWKTTFKIMMSPYSFLRAMGFSPQMAIGLLAVGGTAGTGVVVNETVLADRSFTNGDSGIYAAPAQNPSPTLEQTMAWRKENKEDNTLRIVLSDTPVREIKIENVSVGTVYNG